MTKQLRAEIVAVGTELLLGQIANTNGQWLSKRLADYGINVFHHSVVGDNLGRVRQVFEYAGQRSDIVVVTGGLGPTDDDLTREAFQVITGLNLKEDEVSLNKISNYFKKNHRDMTPNNKKQALVFETAEVFPNLVGMAPGMVVEVEGVTWIFMPGVPREMKQIANDFAFPYIKNKYQLDAVIQSRMLRFIGIGESQLEHELRRLIDAQNNPTIAPLAQEGEVAIRLTAKARSKKEADLLIDDLEKEILSQVGGYFYGYDEETVEEKVIEKLAEKNLKVAIAESLTGGKFTDRLISVPGASQAVIAGIVCYSPQSKQQLVGVNPETIQLYGTVSKQCAEELSQNIQQKLGADIGISFTGVAGPDSSEGKAPGTVFISVHHKTKGTVSREFNFQGGRSGIRQRTVKKGLEMLLQI
ncbi:competence/damage-inducible protein A [Sediminibacillus albus]|uniref:Putative competence-damage inducible protein n=1 Tax=Sediminibacillus albus TaxID=407036 RepID=A0A1G8VY86_9BACI|nr:competence/damage-inducible protein A [Sediminibacillus albus]SDJ71078.1 nicotinamide-nucleotide amidase [Sediminibacillus albus]